MLFGASGIHQTLDAAPPPDSVYKIKAILLDFQDGSEVLDKFKSLSVRLKNGLSDEYLVQYSPSLN